MPSRSPLAGAAALFCMAATATALAEVPKIPGRALATPPRIDGTVEASEWSQASLQEGAFRDQETGSPLENTVKFWLAYDKDFIYFAAQMQDDPRRIKTNQYRQNVSLGGDDWVQLSLEPFARGSGFSQFQVNAIGATNLFIAGGRAPKIEWQGQFRAASRKTESGWETEMAIPWGIMDIPAPGARTLMANMEWYRSASQRRYTWWFTNGQGTLTSLWTDVQVPRVVSRRVLQFLPFLYGGYDDERNQSIVNAGLDFKTSLTSQSQLVGTINPDFRNIENQILSLDFSYFERLAGESRPFFQEGAGFRGGGGGGGGPRLFASQRIGAFDAGLNTFGALDQKSTYSLLATADFGNRSAVVATYNRQATQNLEIGGIYVASYEEGRRNQAGKVSLGNRFGDWSTGFHAALTDDQMQGKGFDMGAGLGYYGAGSYFGAGFSQTSNDFLPRLGFQPERGFRGYDLNYGWERPHPRGPVLETEIGGFLLYRDRLNGDRYRRTASVNGSLTLRNGLDFDASYSQELFEANVDHLWRLNVEFPRREPNRRWQVDFQKGVRRGQNFELFGASFGYRPFQRLQVNLGAQWVSHFEDARQVILSANWERGLYESLSGRVVERGGDINWHMAWRRSGSRGAEYFVILGDPNARRFQRQLIFKVVVPLELKF